MDIEEGKGIGGNLIGYGACPGYPVSEGRPTPRGPEPLCCSGLGIGWILFILGFFLGVFPWFVGALLLCRLKDYDEREKHGFKACAIAAFLATILIIPIVVVVSQFNH